MYFNDIAEKLVDAAKRYAFLKCNLLSLTLYRPDSSKLKFSEVTTFSAAQIDNETEEVLSRVEFVNLGEQKATAECRCELKGDHSSGTSHSNAKKNEGSNTKSGSVRVGVPKIVDVGLFEATGSYSVVNTDGTTNTDTTDSKESTSITQAYLFRQEIPPNKKGLLELCRKTTWVKEVASSVLTITGDIVFSSRSKSVPVIRVPVGKLMNVLLSYTDDETKRIAHSLKGAPDNDGYLIMKITTVPSKIVMNYYSYTEETVEGHKKKLELTAAELTTKVNAVTAELEKKKNLELELTTKVNDQALEISRLTAELETLRGTTAV